MNSCLNCKVKCIEESFKFCPMCAVEIHKEKRCSNCNSEIELSAKFCTECGTKVLEDNSKFYSDTNSIPKAGLGLTVEFKQSTAMSFGGAYDEAIKFDSFTQFGEGSKSLYRVNIPIQELMSILDLVTNLSPMRNKFLYLDGKKINWNDIFGFVSCYSKKEECYKPEYYCFGYDEEWNLNPWGCLKAGLSFNGHGDWYKWGKWLNKEGDWAFDKQRIRHELERNLYGCRYCPALDLKLVEKVILALPDVINPSKNKDWEFEQSWNDADEGLIKKITEHGYTENRLMVGVKPKGKKALKNLMKEAMSEDKISLFIK